MKTLQPFQEKILNVFMGMHGIDAGIDVISKFEKLGSLGKAMLEWNQQERKNKANEKSDS